MNAQDKSETFIKNAVYSSHMLSNLVNDLLDLAKLNNTAFSLNVEKSSLIEQVENAFNIVAFQAEEKGI